MNNENNVKNQNSGETIAANKLAKIYERTGIRKPVLRALLLLGFCAAIVLTLIFTVIGIVKVAAPVDPADYVRDETTVFYRQNMDEEDFDPEEETVFPVEYADESGEISFTVNYTEEEYDRIGENEIFDGFVYVNEDGAAVAFTAEPTETDIIRAARDLYADEAKEGVFSQALTFLILSASMAVIVFFGKHFSSYEKIWFLSIMLLATIVSVLVPEEACNGVSGIWIMLLYLLDTFLNILCELLISKQSKWNFIVSVFVEITEILICVVLMYRFATLASTLFFWLPCDIISFINWHKKPDREEDELTRVRTLKGWQEVLVLVGIVVWTLGIGYLLTRIDLQTEIFGGNEVLENIVCYMDACATVVGILNGLAILFRFREQWVCWFVEAILEGAMNIIAGQWVLLPLKIGYMTNCTYGYIQWTKYIKKHPEVLEEKSIL